jgi:glycerol-1-phosphate dehydrogenase [NAD(P)+]
MTRDHLGIIRELVAGTWHDPTTGKRHGIPIASIAIEETLDGLEADLVGRVHGGKSLIVISDRVTRAALGERVFKALKSLGSVREHVWEKPRCTPEGIDELMEATRDAEALIAVGSGTISDSVKYGSFATGREYSVFATSPMNAYTTPTASIAYDGFKRSVTCHSARGVFFDLGVLARCPRRLVSAAFADVICRTTAQVDWLMSHILFGTPYSETAYVLLAADEDMMVENAAGIMSRDFEALATLTRVSAIMGLGTSFTGTTHVGSMAEHMISHYIDMFAGADHPGTSHGEQVGVATLSMSELGSRILGADGPPRMHPTVIPEADLRRRFGDQTAATMIEQTSRKALDEAQAAALNARFEREWDAIARQLGAAMRPTGQIREAMRTAGCHLTGGDLGLKPGFYRDAIRYSRFIRDRFTMLDVAGDSGQLEAFAAGCE